jgi:hypothetical protein
MRVYLPGVPATSRRVVLPHVVVMGFDETGRVAFEHIYWDQATLLVQVGLLDPAHLPVSGAEQAARLMDPARPANEMSERDPKNIPVEIRRYSAVARTPPPKMRRNRAFHACGVSPSSIHVQLRDFP